MQPFDVSLLPDGIEVSVRDGGETASGVSSTPFLATVTLVVANRYDHTDSLWETLAFGWAVEVDGCVVDSGSLEPWCGSQQKEKDGGDDEVQSAVRRAGDVGRLGGSVPATSGVGDKAGAGEKVSVAKVAFEARPLVPGQECWLTVTGRLRQDTAWAAAGHVVGHSQLELRSSEVRG